MTNSTRRVFVRDLTLEALIGVHQHERVQAQRIIVNLEAELRDAPIASLADTVCYEAMVDAVREIVARGHIELVETLAEEIMARLWGHLLERGALRSLMVRVEKPDALAEAEGVGVELTRELP